jgi:transglutaminase-like putative cysteine protease
MIAAFTTAAWLSLGEFPVPVREWGLMLAFALVPIAAVAVGASRLAIGVTLVVSAHFAASAAYSVPLADMRPRDPQRDFFGPVLGGVWRGVLDFFETRLPFDRVDYPEVQALVLLAIFAFAALGGMFVFAGRPVGASLALVAGAGWPLTLSPSAHPLRVGALALLGVLAILFLLRRRDPVRGAGLAAGLGMAVAALALVGSATDAVAKSAFLGWQSWDPYDRPTEPVSVSYVWDANYRGITFPETPTTVLRVKVSGAQRSLYWRATTLDDYTGQVWNEDVVATPPQQREQIDVVGSNPLLPEEAANEDDWVRQDFTVEALRDTRLLASAQPVRWRPGTEAPVADAAGDVVVVPSSLRRGQRYTVWSYVPRPNPSELNEFAGDYPDGLGRYLEVVYQPVPEWGESGRQERMAVFFGADHADDFQIASLRSLYDAARGITNEARSPYEAAVLLETWFREAGGFVYDEQPPQPLGGEPALVAFVNDTKRGYCQHYAGAMALMLRLLGVPSRVAVGFTSGEYDDDDEEWVVKDTNAHAWVEVWFPGFGWIPFDPTPGRGELGAAYSPTSGEFNAGDAADIGLDTSIGGISPALAEQIRSARPGLEGTGGLGDPGFTGSGGVVRERGPSFALVLLLVLAGAVGAVLVLKAARRAWLFSARDPRRLASACRRDVVAFLADQGVDVPASATLDDLGAMLERYYAVPADALVRDLTLARFGPPGAGREALVRARRELRAVRRQLRRRLSGASRMRGAVSLRSLSV